VLSTKLPNYQPVYEVPNVISGGVFGTIKVSVNFLEQDKQYHRARLYLGFYIRWVRRHHWFRLLPLA
jgi:hypothetical protein